MTLDTRAPDPTLQPTLQQRAVEDAAVSWKVSCLNCGASLSGAFCSECGQRAVPPHPTVRELAGDAVAEFTGWDGKFADTIRTLARRPGELTRQWLAGRRVRFISPLRLYLTASLVFFVLQSMVPERMNGKAGRVVRVDNTTKPGRAAAAANKAMDDEVLTPAERDSALAAVAKAPWILKPMLTKMIDEPKVFQESLRRMLPRMFFALLPLYAGILALFYRRRHYP